MEKTNDSLSLCLSVSEAAEALSVSKPTIYRLIRTENFPAFKIGGRTVVGVAALKAWVDQQVRTGAEI